MSLVLQSQSGWEPVPVGAESDFLTQWLVLGSPSYWAPLPLGAVGYPCRFGNNWRRPTIGRTKRQAAWAARGNLFARYILRRTV